MVHKKRVVHKKHSKIVPYLLWIAVALLVLVASNLITLAICNPVRFHETVAELGHTLHHNAALGFELAALSAYGVVKTGVERLIT